MTLNEYQEQAMTTCMESSNNFAYMMLNLVGEVGELSSKVAKSIRKEKMTIDNNELYDTPPLGEFSTEEFKKLTKEDCQKLVENAVDDVAARDEELKKEAGDILWQLAGLCKVMGWEFEDVARTNLAKLAIRQQEGTIAGNGDGCHKGEGRTE